MPMLKQFSMIKKEAYQMSFDARNNLQFRLTLYIKLSNQSNYKALTCIIKTVTVATVDFKVKTMIQMIVDRLNQKFLHHLTNRRKN